VVGVLLAHLAQAKTAAIRLPEIHPPPLVVGVALTAALRLLAATLPLQQLRVLAAQVTAGLVAALRQQQVRRLETGQMAVAVVAVKTLLGS